METSPGDDGLLVPLLPAWVVFVPLPLLLLPPLTVVVTWTLLLVTCTRLLVPVPCTCPGDDACRGVEACTVTDPGRDLPGLRVKVHSRGAPTAAEAAAVALLKKKW